MSLPCPGSEYDVLWRLYYANNVSIVPAGAGAEKQQAAADTAKISLSEILEIIIILMPGRMEI